MVFFVKFFAPRTIANLRRKLHDEGRARAGAVALRADGAAVRHDDFLRDVETIAGGVGVHRLRILAVTALGEEMLLVFFANADSGIRD